jgi:predicted DNA-binding transcriptional regulator YafY
MFINLQNSFDKAVRLIYKNYRGETAERTIQPIRIWFGETEWHPGKQWLMDAYDLERKANRSFAMKDVVDVINSEEVAV